jgi:hypothetical protein
MFTASSLSTWLGIGAAIAGIVAWYTERTRRNYAREREMAHLLGNLKQTQEAVLEIGEQVDRIAVKMERLEILILRGDGKPTHA